MLEKKINAYDVKTSGKKIHTIDAFIEEAIKKIETVDLASFKHYDKYQEILGKIAAEKVRETLNIGKLMYCSGYKSQIFLYLGITIECLLNEVAQMYVDNGWVTNGKDFNVQFINKSLGDKLGCILGFNLFGDKDTNQIIFSTISSITPLRNYASHSKINSFIERLFYEEQNIDDEINNCLNLINKILLGRDNLTANPPILTTTNA